MKKYLLLLLVLISSIGNLKAQMDEKHWIAPVASTNGSNSYWLYMSTGSLTPFDVRIYNNNTLIGTVTISKGAPQSFFVTNTFIESTTAPENFVVSTKGLYLEGDDRFLCTLRSIDGTQNSTSPTHGEVLTSKGKSGLGNLFYAATTPVTQSTGLSNFFAGIMATEDNTTVTVSGYNPTVVFSNGWTGAVSSFTFTLDANESYIIDGEAAIPGNASGGFIGSKIESDKPIVVSNGNINGNFGNAGGGSDIIMDQSVPADKLGSEFALVKGNGNIGLGLEQVLVIATEDNTEVYVNNAFVAGNPPIATLDEGEWFVIPDSNYVLQANGIYNMYVYATENVYIYQMLNGDATNSYAAGYNYIPPLDCYLPRVIDEVGFVNQLTPLINATNLKLNITTESGATVLVNGIPIPAAQGPYPVSGTANWETYSVPNITGNITITSTKAMTAGMNGGRSTAGWGGYFAGFSTDPEIEKVTGECIPGIKIQTGDHYEQYQWYLNGNPIPGANTFEITPVLPGEYHVVVLISGCLERASDIYEVYTCPTETTIDVYVCNDRTFTPQFTVSPQTIDITKTIVTTAPNFGTTIVDPGNGDIYYTPNAGYNGPDSFVYQFYGDIGQYADTEIVTVNIEVIDLIVTPDTIYGCEYNGVGTFDLSAADVTTYPTATIEYYPTLMDLNDGTNQITNYTTYQSAAGSVYALVITPEGCEEPVEITLELLEQPTVNDDTLIECFVNFDDISGIATAIFDLSQAIVTLDAPVTYEYYATQTNAEQGLNPIGNPTAYSSPNGVVYVKVFNDDGCFDIATITLEVIPPRHSENLAPQYIICLEDKVRLDASFDGDFGYSYQWNTGDMGSSITVGIGEYYVVITSPEGCETTQYVTVLKNPEPVITQVDIENKKVTLHVTGGEPPYQYSVDYFQWQTSNVFENVPRGAAVFYVKDSFDCTPVAIPVIIPNLVNAFTPNGDNVNDYLDYSALSVLIDDHKKTELNITIYDRYGSIVHVGNKDNGYRWDGKLNSKNVPTGTYWYDLTLRSKENNETKLNYSGWVLVKNRD